MLFNPANKYDFKPKLTLEPGFDLTFVESCQLLGVIIQSNLKWNLNTDYICTKAYARIWMVRRLKLLGATNDELTDVYNKQVRCVLELAVAVWSAGLTVSQVAQIERVQKTVCAVILGDTYTDYNLALSVLNLIPLSDRRQELCSNFAQKCYKNDKYRNWFVSKANDSVNVQTRSDKTGLIPVATRTNRFAKSPLPHLTSLLNVMIKK